MKRTVVINQPTYLPWLGYFEQIARADVFVFLDSVQFSRQSWQCRNRLEGPVNGETPWLNVPVARQPLSTVIRDIRIAPERADWAQLHLDAITARLGRAPFFREMLATVEPVLRSSPTHLAELNITLIRAIALLHQHQRPVRQHEHRGEVLPYIDVTLADIAMANALAHQALGRSAPRGGPLCAALGCRAGCAQRHRGIAAARALKLPCHGQREACTGRAQRMPQGDGSAPGVDTRVVVFQAQQAQHVIQRGGACAQRF
jgi:hypothetical protein